MFQATAHSPSVAVPKLAVAENRDAAIDDYKVGLSENPVLFAISNPLAPQRFRQPILDLRPRRADPRHRVVNLFFTRRPLRRFPRLLFQLDNPLQTRRDVQRPIVLGVAPELAMSDAVPSTHFAR